MINVRDMISEVGKVIVEQGFWTASLEEQKEMVFLELYNYTLNKVNLLGLNEEKMQEISNTKTIEELLLYLDKHIVTDQVEKEAFFSRYVFYIIGIIGELQMSSISWFIEDDDKLIKEPVICIDSDGYFNNLMTHNETPPILIVQFIFNILRNEFNLGKKLIKK